MIKGKKVTLRPIKKEDIEKTILWHNDIESYDLLMSHPFPVTVELEEKWIDNILNDINKSSVYFAIDDLQNQFIGIVFLSSINWIHGTCKFHINIGDKNNQGKGYGKDAIELIIDFAFNFLNLRKITLEVIETNKNAIELYKKIGFVQEGKLDKQFNYQNKELSVFILSIFKK